MKHACKCNDHSEHSNPYGIEGATALEVDIRLSQNSGQLGLNKRIEQVQKIDLLGYFATGLTAGAPNAVRFALGSRFQDTHNISGQLGNNIDNILGTVLHLGTTAASYENQLRVPKNLYHDPGSRSIFNNVSMSVFSDDDSTPLTFGTNIDNFYVRLRIIYVPHGSQALTPFGVPQDPVFLSKVPFGHNLVSEKFGNF